MISYIVYFFILLILFKLVIDNARLKARLNKKNIQVIQQALDTKEIIEKLTYDLELEKSKNKKEDDGFLKFVTESREWAYGYIESTQEAIKEVAEDLSKKGFIDDANKLFALLPKDEL